MKAACLVLTLVITIAIMAVCVILRFATNIATTDSDVPLARSMAVVALASNKSAGSARRFLRVFVNFYNIRFPYVAAIISNASSTWSFSCFGSVVLGNWVITSAHCRREGASHRVLLYHDYTGTRPRTHPVLLWRVHERFAPVAHDIALAKIRGKTELTLKSAVFDDKEVKEGETSVWKTVSTMDEKIYLMNDFETFRGNIVPSNRCSEIYSVEAYESIICMDYAMYTEDCFIHEFGPLYASDKVVGLLALKSKDCNVKIAVFTNVSFYANWILRAVGAG